ncbi:MAG: formylglycine-generating enzyme family protein [Candidatus Omnitrophota bacterium]
MKRKISRLMTLPVFIIILLSIALTAGSKQDTGTSVPKGMVLVKGGTFEMGSRTIFNDEEPVHRVKLSGFYIGKYEVTQEEWKRVMGTNPSVFKGDKLPVDTVDWNEAIDYCNKRSINEGLKPCYTRSGEKGDTVSCDFSADGYRLPTEAEWEYAARGGNKSGNFFYCGSDTVDEVGFYESNSDDRTHPVGLLKPNELGIYDMSGNAWEWCWDFYDKDYYKKSPLENPRGPSTGDVRSYRGGGAGARSMWLRCNGRYSNPPGYKHWFVGFRVARSGSGKPSPDMVYIKGGDFNMGSTKGSNGGEKTIHRVTLSSFYMGITEVTQAEWQAVMKDNPSMNKGETLPVHAITFDEAIAYCNKRSIREGLKPCYTISKKNSDDISCDFKANGYRLPTEAEWEYAARGGCKSKGYPFSGSDNLDDIAWYRKNVTTSQKPVGEKKPNELGIYDMTGNVWEWCWDWFDYDYYSQSPTLNPTGPVTGVRRTLRGGCYRDEGEQVLSTSYRSLSEPYIGFHYIGFRVVRNLF